MDGQVEIQDGQNCVSCHQVPSGIWSQELAYRALEQERPEHLTQLIDDAAEFISDPTIGRPAMWSQLMVVINSSATSTTGTVSEPTQELSREWKGPILESQQAGGQWLSKGQFPAQRRPIEESDAVITMWMLAGLTNYHKDDAELAESVRRAKAYIAESKGTSTEWIAWKALTHAADSPELSMTFATKLVEQQNEDGGWGWDNAAESDPYSTGVALFALGLIIHDAEAFVEARSNATSFLVKQQREDGTWNAPSRLFTKTASDRRDYVYHYWGTAWATLGLASELSSRKSDYTSEPTD